MQLSFSPAGVLAGGHHPDMDDPIATVKRRDDGDVVDVCGGRDRGHATPPGPRPRRHALRELLILDRDGDDIRPIPRELSGDLGDERQLSAEMFGHNRAVDPHLGGIVRRPDAQKYALPAPARRDGHLVPVPGGAQVVPRVVEQVIPTARHSDLTRRGQRPDPACRFTFLLRVKLELP
jgi:hypothetical protein